jgi:hypothetical protein
MCECVRAKYLTFNFLQLLACLSLFFYFLIQLGLTCFNTFVERTVSIKVPLAMTSAQDIQSNALKKQRLYHDRAFAFVKAALDYDDTGKLDAALSAYEKGRKALKEAIDLVFTPDEW